MKKFILALLFVFIACSVCSAEIRVYKHVYDSTGSYVIAQYRDGVKHRIVPASYPGYVDWVNAGNTPETIAYTPPPIVDRITAKLAEFQGDYDTYVNAAYSQPVRESLLALYAKMSTPAEVKTELEKIHAFYYGLGKYYYAKRAEILAATAETINTITWSFSFIDVDGEPADAYSEERTYEIGEFVTYGGNLYQCIQAGSNHQPDISGDWWAARATTHPGINPATYLGLLQ